MTVRTEQKLYNTYTHKNYTYMRNIYITFPISLTLVFESCLLYCCWLMCCGALVLLLQAGLGVCRRRRRRTNGWVFGGYVAMFTINVYIYFICRYSSTCHQRLYVLDNIAYIARNRQKKPAAMYQHILKPTLGPCCISCPTLLSYRSRRLPSPFATVNAFNIAIRWLYYCYYYVRSSRKSPAMLRAIARYLVKNVGGFLGR